jgi:enoyl-CoA hydratase
MSAAAKRGAPPVVVRRAGQVAWLTISRLETCSTLDLAALQALLADVETLAAEHDVRAIVFTGAGARAFCAGADVTALQRMDSAEWAAWARLGHRLMDAVAALPQPTIAAINGVAAGGGCELALACDLRLMAASARIGPPEAALGIMPGWGGTQRLPRLIGLGAAKELLYTGRLVDAAEALQRGLVNAILPDDRLLADAQALAERLAGQAPLALAAIKQAIDSGADRDLPAPTKSRSRFSSASSAAPIAVRSWRRVSSSAHHTSPAGKPRDVCRGPDGQAGRAMPPHEVATEGGASGGPPPGRVYSARSTCASSGAPIHARNG